jgi:hypothetical protein
MSAMRHGSTAPWAVLRFDAASVIDDDHVAARSKVANMAKLLSNLSLRSFVRVRVVFDAPDPVWWRDWDVRRSPGRWGPRSSED